MQMYAIEVRISKFIFKKFVFVVDWRIYLHTMSDEKEDKGVISVRPPEGSDIKEKLSKLAEDTERSMNYWAVKAIEELLKKHKIK